MGFQIEDGTGSGASAKVDGENNLQVRAISRSQIATVSDRHGESFTWSHSYNYDAGDTVLLVSNSSTTKKLYIHFVAIGSDTSTQWVVHSPAYPTLAGTEVTGVNTNRISGAAADAEAYGDEIGNTQANILATGFAMGNATAALWPEASIILGYHDTIAVDLVTAGTMGTVTIAAYYHE